MDKLFDSERRASLLYSNGWRRGSGGTLAVFEPATGGQLAEVGKADASDVSMACSAAAEAQPAWASSGCGARAKVMERASQILKERAGEYAEWIIRESGSIRAKALFEVKMGAVELREAAAICVQPQIQSLLSDPDCISEAERVPMGVVGVITPWNVPLILALRSVAPALALGNAVVLKPDPHTPVSGGLILAAVLAEAGLPEGIFHVLPGDVGPGEALIRHPDVSMISFTGSTEVGRQIGKLAGEALKRVALELGGNNAFIVLDDADLDRAVGAAAWSSFFHQGQICMAASRHLVHRSIAERYVVRMAESALELRVGDPYREDVNLGPLIDSDQVARVDRIVSGSRACGSVVLTGGRYKDQFYEPTVLDRVPVEAPAFKQEIFGPVAPVVVFDDDDEAIAIANQTEYGLTAAIHSSNLDRASRIGSALKTGILHINDQTINDDPAAPFGGRGASGNGARYGSVANWDEFTQWRWKTSRRVCPVYSIAGTSGINE
jgi:benzaldehyde dehydrogenase (NAD)